MSAPLNDLLPNVILIIRRPELEIPMTSLRQRVHDFGKAAPPQELATLAAAENEFEDILQLAKQKEQDLRRKMAMRSGWRAKLNSSLTTFCETVYYYQKILDVLNQQAPEYSTAIWGAIKLLLLCTVNNEKLKKGVREHLDNIGHYFSIMSVFVDVQPTGAMVQRVTAAYTDFIIFLKKAVKYYTQNVASQYIMSSPQYHLG